MYLSRPPSPPPDRRLRPCYPCSGEDLERARACEEFVFGQRFGNTPRELADEYAPYEAATTFGAVFSPDGTALGALRLVRPGPGRVKTLVAASRPPWNVPEHVLEEVLGPEQKHAWDVATFAVNRVAAGADPRITPALLSVLFRALRNHAAVSLVATLDSSARRVLALRGMRFLDLPDARPAPYLGSPSSVPVYRHLADLRSEHAAQFPHSHHQVFDGHGIDGLDPLPTRPDALPLPEAV